jgi:HK97 family phage prohead protease
VIRPGAFRDTLARGADVRLLINHEGLPLARTKSGTMRLAEDARGLKMEADLDPDDPEAKAVLGKIKRGDLSQMSFGFVTRADHWRHESGGLVRDLLGVDLLDVSVVTYPAYQATDVAARSLAQHLAQTLPEAARAGLPVDVAMDRLARAESLRAVSTRPNAGMAAAARDGLRLHKAGRSGDGLKLETVRRAKIISRREALTTDHVIEMAAWFARHATDRKPGWDKAGEETPGYTAWQLWGGDAGRDWSKAKAEAIKAERS